LERVLTLFWRGGILAKLFGQHALLRHVQYDGFAAGDIDRLSCAVRQSGPRKRRHVGESAARGVGLIFTNDPEALFAAVNSAEGDGPCRRMPCFCQQEV
jgi:hypothetical protein